jgi:uncharacterized membrane-anchored protein YhcB (DUF1043 family)
MPAIETVLASVVGVLAIGLIVILLRLAQTGKRQARQLAIMLGIGKQEFKFEEEQLEAHAERLRKQIADVVELLGERRESLQEIDRQLAREREEKNLA